jgi:hypothetical protein
VPTICVAKPKHSHPSLVVPKTMTLSPSAALSILLPINIEHGKVQAEEDERLSFDSDVDIQSDDENDREVAEKRLSRYYPQTPISAADKGGAIVRPQFSCPDFGMGTARGMMARIKDAPPVPSIPRTLLGESEDNENAVTRGTPGSSPRRVRKQNSFLQLGTDTAKRPREGPGEETSPLKRKRHGLFLGRLQYDIGDKAN